MERSGDIPKEGVLSFSELIDGYEADDVAKELVNDCPPTFLLGISGAGKDTTTAEMDRSGDFYVMKSHTTRHPRINNGQLEVDGVNYHFASVDYMQTMARFHKFIELKRVHGNDTELGDVYGTSVTELQKARRLGKIAVTDIDVQGIREYKKISDKVVAIFILPPDYSTWRDRLSRRYESAEAFEAEWPKRLKSAVTELREALSLPYYHFIINHEIVTTATVASEIAHRGDVFKRGDDEARLAARDLLAQILERS